MSFSVVIPARYASTRLPGKPLLDIASKPMLQHTWERALLSGASRVVIATDDARILEAANAFGAEVLMTFGFSSIRQRSNLRSGRCARL